MFIFVIEFLNLEVQPMSVTAVRAWIFSFILFRIMHQTLEKRILWKWSPGVPLTMFEWELVRMV